VLPLQSRPGGASAVYFQVATFAPVRHQGAQRVSRMGITGLLPLLAAAQILVGDFWKECRNKRCAFDGHVWLHTFCLVHFEDVSQPEPDYRKVVPPHDGLRKVENINAFWLLRHRPYQTTIVKYLAHANLTRAGNSMYFMLN
jgi:hypothetical protein